MTFYELERACKKRRVKKLLVYSFLFILLLVILFVVFYKSSSKKTQKEVKEIKKENIKKETNKTEIKVKKVEVIKEPKKVNIEVSLIEPEKEVTLEPIIELPNRVEETKPISKPVEKNTSINSSKTQNNLVVTTTLPSYKECIQKAKEFYIQGNYEEAIKWAKNANIQNNLDKESWIITAKSLYKLGEKEKAIDILQTYLKYYKDKDVKETLDEIFNNTLK